MNELVRVRQMMADSQFNQIVLFVLQHSSVLTDSFAEILPYYLQSLKELLEQSTDVDLEKYFAIIPPEQSDNYFHQLQHLRMYKAEKLGQLRILYELINEFFVINFELHRPIKSQEVESYIQKYFKEDFHFKLNGLAITLTLNDLASAELLIQGCLAAILEKPSAKFIKAKLLSLERVLETSEEKSHLKIYRDFCSIAVRGIQQVRDFKKLAEMVIYFDDFKLQVYLINLFQQLQLGLWAKLYAKVITSHSKYNYVFIEKYFPHLVSYFLTVNNQAQKQAQDTTQKELRGHLKLTVTETRLQDLHEESVNFVEDKNVEVNWGGSLTANAIHLTVTQLIEFATGLLQADFRKEALVVAQLALRKVQNQEEELKIQYLVATCMFQLGDYRGVLDVAFNVLSKDQKEEDLLAFLYLQAESLRLLNYRKDAIKVYQKILLIDSNYRFVKERLARINAF